MPNAGRAAYAWPFQMELWIFVGAAWAVTLGVAVSPYNLTAVPGGEGVDSLWPIGLVASVALAFTMQRWLLMAFLMSTAAAHAAVTWRWVVDTPEYSASFLLGSETGLFHVAFCGVPLMVAGVVSRAASLNWQRPEHLSLAARVGALVGLVWGAQAVTEPTLTDHAEALGPELDALELELVSIADQVLDGLQPERAIARRTLDPAPVFRPYGDGNVAFVEVNALAGAWREVYGGWASWTTRHMGLESALTDLLVSRHTGRNSPPVSVDLYREALNPTWLMLYRTPEDCTTRSDAPLEVWLYHRERQELYDTFSLPCDTYYSDAREALAFELRIRTRGTFEF